MSTREGEKDGGRESVEGIEGTRRGEEGGRGRRKG